MPFRNLGGGDALRTSRPEHAVFDLVPGGAQRHVRGAEPEQRHDERQRHDEAAPTRPAPRACRFRDREPHLFTVEQLRRSLPQLVLANHIPARRPCRSKRNCLKQWPYSRRLNRYRRSQAFNRPEQNPMNRMRPRSTKKAALEPASAAFVCAANDAALGRDADQNRTVRPPDHALRRAKDEELVVDGRVRRKLAEHVADAEQHLPLRVGEIQERQGLRHLHVEPGAGSPAGRLRAGSRRMRC